MAQTITKLFANGALQASVELNEVTYSSIKVGPNGIFASQFDEVNLAKGTAERQLTNGTYQVSGYFDEQTINPKNIP